jgi:hypothetical protein
METLDGMSIENFLLQMRGLKKTKQAAGEPAAVAVEPVEEILPVYGPYGPEDLRLPWTDYTVGWWGRKEAAELLRKGVVKSAPAALPLPSAPLPVSSPPVSPRFDGSPSPGLLLSLDPGSDDSDYESDSLAEAAENVEVYAEVLAGNKRKIVSVGDEDMKRVRHPADESFRTAHWAQNAPLALADAPLADPPPCQAKA